MPAPELRLVNRAAYFRKAIRTPDFGSERVLARDAFEFAELWLRPRHPAALPYWKQARAYYRASQLLPVESSPLTTYYCFLNAVKALLTVKDIRFSAYHGVSGQFEASKRALGNETIEFKSGGVIAALSSYLEEPETESGHTLKDVLSNLPFIHRAFRFTFRSHPELFIPLRNVVYRKHGSFNEVWITAEIEGRYNNPRSLGTIPSSFEKDHGYKDRCIIRTKKRVKWCAKDSSEEARNRAMDRLHRYHRKLRHQLVYISASPDLWYVKRRMAGAKPIHRYGMTLIVAAMHRLSELARYDPSGLVRYLDGRESWLLTEFIELAPQQFMDELVCEMTSLEVAYPGIRPRST